MTIDSLYKMQSWRVNVNSTSEFIECVDADIEKGMLFESSDLVIAKNICEEQFAQTDASPLDNLIQP